MNEFFDKANSKAILVSLSPKLNEVKCRRVTHCSHSEAIFHKIKDFGKRRQR